MKNISVYFGESLVAKLPKYIKSFVYANGEFTINVDFCHISKVLFFIKNHSTTQYKVLIDMTAVDSLSFNIKLHHFKAISSAFVISALVFV